MKYFGEHATVCFVTVPACMAFRGCKEKPAEQTVQAPSMTAAEKCKKAIEDAAAKTGEAVKDTAIKGWMRQRTEQPK